MLIFRDRVFNKMAKLEESNQDFRLGTHTDVGASPGEPFAAPPNPCLFQERSKDSGGDLV